MILRLIEAYARENDELFKKVKEEEDKIQQDSERL